MCYKNDTMKKSQIVCFGEVLWDVLPTGKIAGGAPMNVAFHARQLGLSAKMISRVGADELGSELLHFFNMKGVETTLVQIDAEQPTGVVLVELDAAGTPSYDIVQPSAWDFIETTPEILDTVHESDVFVFGSLACRAAQTRETLLTLLENANLRVFDVNLRQPYFEKKLLENLLTKADIVKMNDHELVILAGWFGAENETPEAQMRALQSLFDLDMLVVTRGGNGAACLSELGYCETPGKKVVLRDTIGSGDAFLAGFLSRMLAGENAAECLRFANAIGAFVATKEGGTPLLEEQEILALQ